MEHYSPRKETRGVRSVVFTSVISCLWKRWSVDQGFFSTPSHPQTPPLQRIRPPTLHPLTFGVHFTCIWGIRHPTPHPLTFGVHWIIYTITVICQVCNLFSVMIIMMVYLALFHLHVGVPCCVFHLYLSTCCSGTRSAWRTCCASSCSSQWSTRTWSPWRRTPMLRRVPGGSCVVCGGWRRRSSSPESCRWAPSLAFFSEQFLPSLCED